MSTPLNSKKYDRLVQHLVGGGDNDIETILSILKVGSADVAQNYIDQFKTEYAHLIEEEETPEAEVEEEEEVVAASPKSRKSAPAPAVLDSTALPPPVDTDPSRLRYFLSGENNVLQPLVLIRHKGERVILRIPAPRIVKLMVKGSVTDFDMTTIDGKDDTYFVPSLQVEASVIRAAAKLAE